MAFQKKKKKFEDSHLQKLFESGQRTKINV